MIRVDRQGLPATEFQKSLPQVGTLAVVLGSPLGFEKTVTAGIVSGLPLDPGLGSPDAFARRPDPDRRGDLSRELGWRPGRRNRRITGISVAYVPPQHGAVAVGFAIPAATVTRVADDLLEHGHTQHAYLGLQPAPLTPEVASELHITDGGVLVYALSPDGPASRAGIRPGDVLTAVAGQKITSVEELLPPFASTTPAST